MPIAKMPNSRFLWYDFRYRGRRYRGSTKETSKAAARQFEAQLIANLEQTDELPVRGRRAPLLRDFLPRFLASFEQNQLRAEKSKRYYRTGAKLIQATALKEFAIDRITTSIVAAVRWPHSGSTANNAIRTLSAALNYAVELGHMRAVPRMHLHKETAREMVFTPEYEARLLAVAPQPLADVFVILMDTGMRPEEVYRMRWEDVRWTENLYHVPDGKTDAAERNIGMSGRVLEVLHRRVRDSKDSPWVFTSKRGGGKSHIATVNKAFSIARKAAGLPKDLVLYSTRHTFGTHMMKSTRDMKLTMKTMGHVDVKTAARYQHPDTGEVAGVMDERNAKSAAMVPINDARRVM